jgi:hypothetical protein
MTIDELKSKFLPNPDDVIVVKSLFLHPGWIRYEDRVKDMIAVLDYNIEQLTNGNIPITVDNISILNEQIAERRMLKLMLVLKDELIGEVDPQYGDVPIEKPNFDVTDN